MKILLNPSYINAFKKCSHKENQPTQIPLPQQNFCAKSNAQPPYSIYINIKNESKNFQEFISNPGKVSLKQYKKIAKEHPRILTMCARLCERTIINTTPQKFAQMSIALKKYYDDLYDKNYTILSIGTSPALITETMKNLGANVVFLPISDLRFLEKDENHILRHRFPTLSSQHHNINVLMDYCTKKKINKKENGELIVLDYTWSGQTLDLMAKILKERGDIKPERLHKHSLMNDIEEAMYAFPELHISNDDIKTMKLELRCSKYENMTNIPHFPYNGAEKSNKNCINSKGKKNKKIFKEFENFSTTQGRAWSLCTLHEAMKILKR